MCLSPCGDRVRCRGRVSTPGEDIYQDHQPRTHQGSQDGWHNQPEPTPRLLQISFQILDLINSIIQSLGECLGKEAQVAQFLLRPLQLGQGFREFINLFTKIIDLLTIRLPRHFTLQPARSPRLVRRVDGAT